MRRPFFAVLGGMGTLATESYVRLLDKRTQASTDQEYLDYVVFNDAGVPDRTAFILGHSTEDPVPSILDDIDKATSIGASFLVLACNTEHYFFDRFQAGTPVPLLHMPRLAVQAMSRAYPAPTHPRVGFLGTEGSRAAGVYRREVTAAGYDFVEPDDALQHRVDSLIYDDVKGGRTLDPERYHHTVLAMMGEPYHCDIVILGCTELSVFNERFPMPDCAVIDAQSELVDETVRRGKSLLATASENREHGTLR